MSSFEYLNNAIIPFRVWLAEWKWSMFRVVVNKPKGRPANRLWINEKEWEE